MAADGIEMRDIDAREVATEPGLAVDQRLLAVERHRIGDEASARLLRSMRGVSVMHRSDGALLALFESPYWLERLQADQPELVLERIVAE